MEKRDFCAKKNIGCLRQNNAGSESRGKSEHFACTDNFANIREQFKNKYGQLIAAGENAWEDTKEGTGETWNKLKSSFARSIALFEKCNNIVTANVVTTQLPMSSGTLYPNAMGIQEIRYDAKQPVVVETQLSIDKYWDCSKIGQCYKGFRATSG